MPNPMPTEPFPEPAHPPTPPAQTPSDPVNVPPPAPDVIFPGQGDPAGIPPMPAPDIPPLQEPPMIAWANADLRGPAQAALSSDLISEQPVMSQDPSGWRAIL